jgi:anthranilate/para-aminobenzoate synthase component I
MAIRCWCSPATASPSARRHQSARLHRQVHAALPRPPASGLPRFCGGLVGCFGYDTVRYVETRLTRTHKPDEIGTPDIGLLLSEEIAVVDNLSGKLTLIVYAEPGFPAPTRRRVPA